ncbi:MAG: hypothetical protein II453_09455 [Alphaproteobacteria bacterium]|nr:hypothetical protein [Alphaproteobacteria bacterium]MBQ3946621.1 hypothetical protein [Alphaproteobacteria bacterium]
MINPLNIDMTTLYDGAKEIVEMYKQELHNQKVDATGALRNSVDFDFDFDENDITLYFIANSYWYYVEKGRQPDGSGVGPSWTTWERDLTNWINKKIARGWWIPKQNQTIPRTAKELKGVSYLIRRKIKDEGWYTDRDDRGLHILENVLKNAESSGLIQRMKDSVAKGFENEISVELEKI